MVESERADALIAIDGLRGLHGGELVRVLRRPAEHSAPSPFALSPSPEPRRPPTRRMVGGAAWFSIPTPSARNARGIPTAPGAHLPARWRSVPADAFYWRLGAVVW